MSVFIRIPAVENIELKSVAHANEQPSSEARELPAEVICKPRARLFGVRQSATNLHAEADPVCEHDPYPRYPPGRYEAQCFAVAIYKDPQFHCWKAQLIFRTVLDGRPVHKFFHLGDGEKPKAGPRSEYRRAWIIANDGPPRRRQTLSRRVFIGKIFEVEIDDVKKRYDGQEHAECAIYSVIKVILRRTHP